MWLAQIEDPLAKGLQLFPSAPSIFHLSTRKLSLPPTFPARPAFLLLFFHRENHEPCLMNTANWKSLMICDVTLQVMLSPPNATYAGEVSFFG
jgi:hypothetical protein